MTNEIDTTTFNVLLGGKIVKCNDVRDYAHAMSTAEYITRNYVNYMGKRCTGISVCGNAPWTVKVEWR